MEMEHLNGISMFVCLYYTINVISQIDHVNRAKKN